MGFYAITIELEKSVESVGECGTADEARAIAKTISANEGATVTIIGADDNRVPLYEAWTHGALDNAETEDLRTWMESDGIGIANGSARPIKIDPKDLS